MDRPLEWHFWSAEQIVGALSDLVATAESRLEEFPEEHREKNQAAVRPDHDPRGRYVRAQGCLLTPDGVPLAACEVRFAGSAAYTRRLLQPFLETTDPEILFRLFPNARAFGQRESGDGGRPT